MTSPIQQQFEAFANAAFADGALSAKTKELIAFAAAHITQSRDCIVSHGRRAVQLGATEQELIEAMWVATVMRAGAALSGDGDGAETAIKRAVAALRL
jgi:AhpD family alkylhydroperoxidase